MQYLEIFAVGIAVHEALVAAGVAPFAIVGQSVGELWALAAAGRLSVEDAARLAVARSRALTRQGWDGAMLAVGASGREAAHLAGLIGHPDLVLACENAPRQSVLSGPAQEIAEAARLAEVLGWPHSRLDFPHYTHTPAVTPAARALREQAPRVPYGPGRWRVWSTQLGREAGDWDPVEMVASSLTMPVRLLDVVRDLHAAGAEVFVECGERLLVGRLVQATVPAVHVYTPLAEPGGPVHAIGALAAGKAGSLRPAPRIGAAPSSPTVSARALPGTGAGTGTRTAGNFSPPAVTQPPSASSIPQSLPPPTPASAQAAAPVPAPALAPAPAVAQVLTAVPPPATATVAAGTPSALGYADVLRELQVLYGEFLGYPPELLGEDDSLEADLGVESLKQVTLLARVAERFDVAELRGNASLLDHGTLRRIAETVVSGGSAPGAGR
ncbi:acyltransferase domain-containing protein [Streptomyces sp. NPDC059443]|uniref:acyl carrier protein n=1 Tax=unclassified Streptomyces TaxID=2593676 RepID=UPI00367DF639